jgi:hypothetical protein
MSLMAYLADHEQLAWPELFQRPEGLGGLHALDGHQDASWPDQ